MTIQNTEPPALAPGDRVHVSIWAGREMPGHSLFLPTRATFVEWDRELADCALVEHRSNGAALRYAVHWQWVHPLPEGVS